MSADEWVRELGLIPHPEGGAYAQTWRDESSSAIYYLLRAGEESAWHRVEGRSEVWHHYAGGPLTLRISVDGESLETHLLGIDIAAGQRPQIVVPPDAWQSATSTLGEATLVGCTVAPPFTFDAFELAPAGWAPGQFGPLVSAGWLASHLTDVALIDVRWYLDGRSGREAFEQAHLPGAVWLDLDAYLADPPSAAAGRHPLPSPERFAAGMSAAGTGATTKVVAYDDNGGMSASRLVWLLRALGHPAALLDGGLTAWTGALESGPVAPLPATFEPVPWPPEKLVGIDEVSDAAVLLDARAPERYRGEQEPIDPRAGHIPGALNAPWQSNLDAAGRFSAAAVLRRQFAAAGAVPDEDVVVYCGSGVSACHTLLALEASGVNARLYPGSWSQWSGQPDRPAATG
ncbi:MAG: Rhodanese domain protein [Mycobacterium sp.]|nr:Rhodanese domain protein [Mycobacterium sp.]